MADPLASLRDLFATNFTSTVHRNEYPAISPTRPELNQAGRGVLITGGGTGIGKSIAQHFIRASAATVIIVGRRQEVLDKAATELEEEAKAIKSPSVVIAKSCDVTSPSDVKSLWDSLAEKKVNVDVLVLNAAKFTEPKTLLELGAEEVWSQIEANVKGPIFITQRFLEQNQGKQKFLVSLTSAVIHALQHPMVIPRASYSLSKASGTLYVQLLANQIPVDELQIVTYHPGAIFSEGWAATGITKDMLPFDDVDLGGAFAVWAASREAKFLNGRVVWASWDVTELAQGDIPKRLEEDGDYLRLSVVGFKGNQRA